MSTSFNSMGFEQQLDAINAKEGAGQITPEKAKQLRDQLAESHFGGPSFDINEFSNLLGRLEGSKMRQQRQKSVEGRRDIFAGGLAGMMNNF